jgi:hypothetical protein
MKTKLTLLALALLIILVLVGFAQIEGVTNFTGVQIKATSLGTATPLLEIYNQGVGQSLVIRDSGGTPEFVVNANGGVTANSLTAAVIGASASGQKCVYGTQAISGTGTIAHGLATPAMAQLTLAEDVTGDGSEVSYTNSAAVVTAKIWNSAATPAASVVTHTVAYYICGTP